jgi:D-cysteine desulfhydrase
MLDSGDLALGRRFPRLGAALLRVPLTTLPTPVHRLDGLSRLHGLDLWVKRDDVSGAAYGGNKPRKLEFVLATALRRGRRTVMTFGGIGTHHGLATVIAARTVGLRTILVLLPQPVTPHVRRCLQLDYAYGAELHLAKTVVGVAATAVTLLVRGTLRGEQPAIVPVGGTSVTGAIGYVNAGLELAEQVAAGEMPEPSAIFVPLGSGGTVAGLAAGLALAGLRARVVGVLVTDLLPPSPARLHRLARATLRRLRRLDPAVPDVVVERPEVQTQWVGAGYGAPTAAGVAAGTAAARHDGLTLESTYTEKCLAALLAQEGAAAERGPMLFWNTFSSVDPAAGIRALPEPDALPAAFRVFFSDVT